MPRNEAGRECLAVYPRQLAFQPRLPLLRRHPPTLLLCLEQARRPALDHYVDRIARLGTAVLINGTWYKAGPGGARSGAPWRRPAEGDRDACASAPDSRPSDSHAPLPNDHFRQLADVVLVASPQCNTIATRIYDDMR